MNDAALVLEDGSVYPGRWFGAQPLPAEALAAREAGARRGQPSHAKLAAGEVIFNTGMCGYHEILTDPSYYGQIIVMTYPHIGNYGTDEQWTEYGSADAPWPEDEAGPEDGSAPRGSSEAGPSDDSLGRLKASGLVVRSLYEGPVPPGRRTLPDFLAHYRTSGITEVDTRALTLRIRSGGSPRGVIVAASGDGLDAGEREACLRFLSSFPEMQGRDLVSELDPGRMATVNPSGSPHVSVVDCGVKAGIVRELLALGCRVTLVPNRASANDILATKPHAVLYSNGPGDPAVLDHLVGQIRELLGKLPIWGICLGHQLLALALGARTYKMKFGHHGVNNPVRDETSGAILITSQNHGFAVDERSLPADVDVWFRNANDRSNEGLTAPKLHAASVQFHPEAAPGPRDSIWIFRRFMESI